MLESMFVKERFQPAVPPPPKAFPSGGRCPSAHTGANEGAIGLPNGAGEERRRGDRPIFLQGKVGDRIAPSSVTFGDSFPPRGSLWVVLPYPKKRPKSGHADGRRNSPTTETMRHNRQNERASSERAITQGGRGASPRDSLRPGFLLEKAWIPRPGPGGNPPRRAHPAMVQTGPPADGRPPNSPAIIPESRPDDNQRERLACRKQARPAVSGLLKKCILEISIGSALCYPGDSSPGGIFLGPIA